ncbi:MAG: ATP-binding protein [Acidobacteriota bacterium]
MSEKQEAPAARKWRRLGGWQIALAGFLLGVLDTYMALEWGLEFRRGDQDETLFVGAFLSISFGLFGLLLGMMLQSRRRERKARRQLQENLQRIARIQARLAQTEKLASLGQMASALAHEVRNPLAIVRSMLQNLSEEPVSEEVRAACDQMIDEIDRLKHVTASMLRFARPLRLKLKPVLAQQIVDRVRLLAPPLLDGRRIDFQVSDLQTRPAQIDADADLICQALLGLLSNAAQATAESGKIQLRCQESESGLEFSVSDDGPGIAEEIREKIFEPFFTTRTDGSGLGLGVARQIVEAHGGRLEADAGRVGGACFRIRLPNLEDVRGVA